MQSTMLELVGQARVAELRREADQADLATIARRRARKARYHARATRRLAVAPGRPGRAMA